MSAVDRMREAIYEKWADVAGPTLKALPEGHLLKRQGRELAQDYATAALAALAAGSGMEEAVEAVMADLGSFENADDRLLWLGRVTHVLKTAAPLIVAQPLQEIEKLKEQVEFYR